MNKSTKIILITAGALVGTGIILGVTGGILSGFGKKGADNADLNYEKKTMTISEDFSAISDMEIDADVVFVPSDSVVIEYYDCDEYYHEIEVIGDTLSIEVRDTNKTTHWWENMTNGWNSLMDGSSEDEIATTIYLPLGVYGKLDIGTVSGDISIPEGYSFDTAEFSTISGSVDSAAALSGNCEFNTTSGDITASNIDAGTLEVNSISGEVTLANVTASGTTEISTTSGDVSFTDSQIGVTELNTVSGAVSLNGCTVGETRINTVSGDVNGTLIGEYSFDNDTASGDINIASSVSGGTLIRTNTVSGDIEFR